MALLKLSGMATAISGKLGGSIFATTQNGSIIKQNSWAQQHASPRQSAQRSVLYPVTQKWRSLTPTQRANWNADAVNYPYTNRVGDIVYYNGYQLFNLVNQNRPLISLAQIDTPNAVSLAVTPAITMSEAGFEDFLLHYTAGSTNNGYKFYFTPPRNNEVTPKLSDFLYYAGFPVSVVNGQFAIGADYMALYPSFAVGQFFWAYVQPVDNTSGVPAAPSNFAILERTL